MTERHMIVLADDITGAAEISGIAFEAGHQVRLVCKNGSAGAGVIEGGSAGVGINGSLCSNTVAAKGTTVIATDMRSMSEAEAAAETRRITSAISHLPSTIFKKTDSALRGHVMAELTALMETTGYQRAVYMPANPSKGRIIKDGTYYVKGPASHHGEEFILLHETAFSYDPEFPAKTSVLKDRFPGAEAKGIIMPDAESLDDIRHIVTHYNDGNTLFAGAADLFREILQTHQTLPHCVPHSDLKVGEPLPVREGSNYSQGVFTDGRLSTPLPHREGLGESLLILCGSTQSKALDLGIPVAPMPKEVYDGSNDLSLWDVTAWEQHHSLILTIPYTHPTGKEVAIHLRTVMAEMAKRLVNNHLLPFLAEGQERGSLIIEGGATAWATLQALGWSEFEIVRQYAPGVVQMRPIIACGNQTFRSENVPLVTLKPGSYPWGGVLG